MDAVLAAHRTADDYDAALRVAKYPLNWWMP
jgi:hypothetical protein